MCDFLSVCMDKKGERICAGNLTSHSETAALFGLKPDEYVEVEWTDESEDKLTVRTHPDYPHNENWYRACVLAHGKTRAAFLEYCLSSLHKDAIPNLVIAQTLNAPALNKCGSLAVRQGATLNAPALNKCGSLYVWQGATLNAPALTEIGGSLYLRQGATLNAPALNKCGSLAVRQGATLNAPALTGVN